MAELELIGLGAAPNDSGGNPLRTGGEKINDNFTELNIRTKNSNKIPHGKYQVFRDAANVDPDINIDYEENDIIFGRWSGDAYDNGEGTILAVGQMVMAKYNGGTKTQFTNYSLIIIY